MPNFQLLSVLVALSLLGSTGFAHAYLDPGNGSMIAQAVLAGIAGVAVTMKFYWAQIMLIFKRNGGKKD